MADLDSLTQQALDQLTVNLAEMKAKLDEARSVVERWGELERRRAEGESGVG